MNSVDVFFCILLSSYILWIYGVTSPIIHIWGGEVTPKSISSSFKGTNSINDSQTVSTSKSVMQIQLDKVFLDHHSNEDTITKTQRILTDTSEDILPVALQEQKKTLIESLKDLWNSSAYLTLGLIVLFSIIVPLVKCGMCVCAYLYHKQGKRLRYLLQKRLISTSTDQCFENNCAQSLLKAEKSNEIAINQSWDNGNRMPDEKPRSCGVGNQMNGQNSSNELHNYRMTITASHAIACIQKYEQIADSIMRALRCISKYQLVDTYVVCFTVAFLNINVVHTRILTGAKAFMLYCLISILTTQIISILFKTKHAKAVEGLIPPNVTDGTKICINHNDEIIQNISWAQTNKCEHNCHIDGCEINVISADGETSSHGTVGDMTTNTEQNCDAHGSRPNENRHCKKSICQELDHMESECNRYNTAELDPGRNQDELSIQDAKYRQGGSSGYDYIIGIYALLTIVFFLIGGYCVYKIMNSPLFRVSFAVSDDSIILDSLSLSLYEIIQRLITYQPSADIKTGIDKNIVLILFILTPLIVPLSEYILMFLNIIIFHSLNSKEKLIASYDIDTGQLSETYFRTNTSRCIDLSTSIGSKQRHEFSVKDLSSDRQLRLMKTLNTFICKSIDLLKDWNNGFVFGVSVLTTFLSLNGIDMIMCEAGGGAHHDMKVHSLLGYNTLEEQVGKRQYTLINSAYVLALVYGVSTFSISNIRPHVYKTAEERRKTWLRFTLVSLSKLIVVFLILLLSSTYLRYPRTLQINEMNSRLHTSLQTINYPLQHIVPDRIGMCNTTEGCFELGPLFYKKTPVYDAQLTQVQGLNTMTLTHLALNTNEEDEIKFVVRGTVLDLRLTLRIGDCLFGKVTEEGLCHLLWMNDDSCCGQVNFEIEIVSPCHSDLYPYDLINYYDHQCNVAHPMTEKNDSGRAFNFHYFINTDNPDTECYYNDYLTGQKWPEDNMKNSSFMYILNGGRDDPKQNFFTFPYIHNVRVTNVKLSKLEIKEDVLGVRLNIQDITQTMSNELKQMIQGLLYTPDASYTDNHGDTRYLFSNLSYHQQDDEVNNTLIGPTVAGISLKHFNEAFNITDNYQKRDITKWTLNSYNTEKTMTPINWNNRNISIVEFMNFLIGYNFQDGFYCPSNSQKKK